MQNLTTVADVFQVLGSARIRKSCAATSQMVWNWKRDKKFPADTFLVLQRELKSEKYTADPSLWGMKT